MQSAAGAALAIGISVSTATLAQAACTPGAVDATTPAPGSMVTCTGTTTNQNDPDGYGTGNQTGITINVTDGATVEGVSAGGQGIWVGDAVINNGVGALVLGRTNGILAATGSLAVTNFGSITATTNGAGITAATGVTLTNHAAGAISGQVNGVASTSGAITVDNSGNITAGSGGGVIASGGAVNVTNRGTINSTTGTGISASADVTLTNQASGAILGGADGVVSTAGAVTVDNAGSITGTGQAAIDAGADVTVTNRAGGVISGGTRGIFSRGGNITLDNAGSITSTGGVATVSAGFDSVKLINRAGASISGGVVAFQAVDVHNSGDIGSVTATSVKLVNTATGTIGSIGALGESDINNFGTVTNDVVGNGSLVNHAGGRILGLVRVGFGGGGLSVVNHAGGYIGSVAADMSFDNSGTIGHVELGGNAQLVNNAGASITSATYAVIGSFGSTASIVNAGTISGTNAAIQLVGGNTVANLAGGNILGGTYGVVAIFDVSITNSGNISGGAAPSAGIFAGGALQLVNNVGASISGSEYGIYAAVGNASIVNSGSISGGTAAIQFVAPGNTLTLMPGSVISGNVIGFGSDTLQLGGIGAANFDISQLGLDPTLQYSGFTAFNKIDSSSWTLTGASTYAGPVNVDGGTLAVNGNLAAASLLTLNAGGILGGTGTLGATVINGGTLAPGNSIGTLTMSSLTMTAASTYLVQVSGAASDRTIVTGTAAIAGKVRVDPLTRLTSTTTYTIVNGGTLTGTFDSASLTNNFGRNARLSYVGNNVLLTIDPGLLSPVLPGNASINNRNVARGIDNGLEGGAILPASFNGLFLLTGNNLLNALTQISGETSIGSQQTTFDAMTQFMGLVSDPFTAGRGGTAPAPFAFAEDEALAYAPNGRKRTRTERDAFAMFTKAPPRAYEARWNVWAAGFGGSRTTDGNTALGSNRTTGNIAAVAVGADYWFSPSTVAGFALAGGGTSFSVANGGSGRSDLFQAGAFVRHNFASSYITATAAYGWQDISTDRLITAVGTERLRANFNANAFSGRIEGGNRWLVPQLAGIGLTPYAAVQLTAFDLPAYAETSADGVGGFALNYAAKTVTATRTELGLRGDKSFAVDDALLTLRGRAAWAYNYNTDRNVSAVFESLPGSAFIVNGARAAHNAALTSASAEMSFNGGWSVAATFEGEFSDVSRSFAGKGAVRYAW
jgi:uncharacterized protein with beta-barrel porin domain